MADSRTGEHRRIIDPLPLGVPQQFCVRLDRLGLGQPFRGQHQRYVRFSAPLEPRGEAECRRGAPYTPYDLDKSSLVGAWDVQGRPYYDYARYNTGRLDAFAQLDVRLDKVFYFRRCMLGFYIDLQNVTVSKYRSPDVVMSTGEIENPEAPASEQRYRMKTLEQVSGTLLPTLGVTVEF